MLDFTYRYTTVDPKAAKRSIPYAIWVHCRLSTFRSIEVRLQTLQKYFLLITKKRRSCEIIKNSNPMWGRNPLDKIPNGRLFVWSTVSESNEHSNLPPENLISFRINSPTVSDASISSIRVSESDQCWKTCSTLQTMISQANYHHIWPESLHPNFSTSTLFQYS